MTALKLTDDLEQAASRISAEMGTTPYIHENDHLLRHIVNKWGPEKGVENYLMGGRNDAAKIRNVIQRLNVSKEPWKVLDFAAGFGRVARHVKYLMEQHDIFASDIHPDACEFMAERLGIPSICSTMVPEELRLQGKYDFIYVMSLFSHLPEKTFGRWVSALYRHLSPGGYLLFTVNGMATRDRFPDFFGTIFSEEKGFGYREESDQLDISPEEYGSMIVSIKYLIEVFELHAPGAQVHSFTSGAWFGSQDEWILRKPT